MVKIKIEADANRVEFAGFYVDDNSADALFVATIKPCGDNVVRCVIQGKFRDHEAVMAICEGLGTDMRRLSYAAGVLDEIIECKELKNDK